jgi:hypothetical protein
VCVFEREDQRLNPRTCQDPGRKRCQLPAPQFLRRQTRRTFARQRNIEERRKQRGILHRVEVDLRQGVLQVGEALLSRYIGSAETHPGRFRDRVQSRVL